MKKCTNCNKDLKAARPHVCVLCGKPLCYACRNKHMLCSDCFVQANEQNVINEYFKEKYAMSEVLKC